MKRYTLTLLALCAAFLSAGYLLGQGQSKAAGSSTAAPAAPAAAAAPQQKLIKVATLSTAQANRDFQANVQLVQMQRQAAIELNSKIEAEKDAAKKKELKSQFDALMAKLNENNQAMVKNYGFSLTRNYTMEVEVSHIYLIATDEEIAQIEKAQKEQDKKGKK